MESQKKIEPGAAVQVVAPVIAGVVVRSSYNNAEKHLTHLVRYTGVDGAEHERWYIEAELKLVNVDSTEEGAG